jgi:hypothetical protein
MPNGITNPTSAGSIQGGFSLGLSPDLQMNLERVNLIFNGLHQKPAGSRILARQFCLSYLQFDTLLKFSVKGRCVLKSRPAGGEIESLERNQKEETT